MKNLQALRANLAENKINLLTDQAAFMVKGGGGGYGCGCYCGH